MEDEHPNIKNEDWRLQAITTLAKTWTSPFSGVAYEAGSPVSLSSTAKYKNKKLTLKVPSVCALFLDFSHQLWMECEKNFKRIFLLLSSKL